MNTPPFYFKNGKIAKNLSELEDILGNISIEDFEFHVNSNKNDFANWIQDCLKNKELADALRTTTDKEETIDFIQQELSMNDKTYRNLEDLASTAKYSDLLDVKTMEPSQKPKQHNTYKNKIVQENTTFDYQNEKHPTGITKVHKITTEAPHEFILKEFLLGAIFGLLMGIILMATLRQIGVL